jgi:hypothetical protein
MTPKMELTITIDNKKYDLVYKDSNVTRFEKVRSEFMAKGYTVKAFDPNGRGFWYLYAREK